MPCVHASRKLEELNAEGRECLDDDSNFFEHWKIGIANDEVLSTDAAKSRGASADFAVSFTRWIMEGHSGLVTHFCTRLFRQGFKPL
ncbi:MAG: hypothetical protein NVS3B20_17100 [Polyangiales bacterium]